MGEAFRMVPLEELHEFNLAFLLNSYIRALAVDEPDPHDFLMAAETKLNTSALNFGWRYQGASVCIVEKDGDEEGVTLDVCGGETELLYLFKVFALIDDYSLYWKDGDVSHAADFLYASVLRPLVRFERFTMSDALGVDYHEYMGVRDSRGRTIVDYDVARAAQFGASPLLAGEIRSNRGREIVEVPLRQFKEEQREGRGDPICYFPKSNNLTI